MKSAQTKSIPQDLIVDIFSWLPIKSLLRYRCVSKFYNSLVSASNFMDIHHRRSMTRPGGRKYLMYKKGVFYTTKLKEDGKASHLPIENFNPLHRYLSTSCLMCVDGFVCGWRDANHVAICNFGTREVRFIRCPKEFVNEDYPVCSIGFEPEEQKYKLWLTIYLTDGYTRNWVFTLDIDKSWRQTKCNARFFPTKRRVCFNGVIFMFSFGYRDSLYQMVAFDVKAETFSTFTFSPTLPFNDYINHNLIEVKGKLGVLNYSSEDIQLWVFGKAQNDDWKRHVIPCPSQLEGIDVKLKSYSRFVCSCDGEIIFESITKSGSYIYICYNITRESWREFEVGTLYVKREFDGIFCYVENLFPLGKLCNANLQD